MPFNFPERLFPHGKYDSRHMRMFALTILWISIIYNGVQGCACIIIGANVVSRALIVFGIQSLVEILSTALVVHRFHKEFQNDSPTNLKMERQAILDIGILFIILAFGTSIVSIVALVGHTEPESSTGSLIVSAGSLVCMILIWLPKPWIALELDSHVTRAEATCSLERIYLTIVLFIGSLMYKLWQDGWWIDSVTAILLGFFVFREGWLMISWARSKDFNGGYCRTCCSTPIITTINNNAVASSKRNDSCSSTCSASSASIDATSHVTTFLLGDHNNQNCACCVKRTSTRSAHNLP